MGVGGSYSESGTQERNPFGGLPYQLSGRLGGQLNPLLSLLGFGPQAGSARAQHQQQQLAGATGPLASLIEQIRSFSPDIVPQSQAAGQQIAMQGSEQFKNLTTAINQAQKGLGAVQQRGAQYMNEAFDPLSQSPFFAEESKRALSAMRPGEAARGVLDSGAGQAAEARTIEDLTTQEAANQRGMQGQALQIGQGLATAGVPLAETGLNAIPQLAQALTQQFNLPLQTAGGLLSLLTSGQNPAMSLLGLIAPQFTPQSKGMSQSASL